MIGRDPKPTARVDERDTMFARMARRPGTPSYVDYYSRRQELQAFDDRLRGLPPLCSPGGRYHDPRLCREAEGYFRRIGEIETGAPLLREWEDRTPEAADPARVLKRMVLSLGAVAAGWAPLDPAYTYTYKGRFDEDYGKPVDLPHTSVLVFLVEMDHEAMQRAPRAETIRESARQYYRAARIAKHAEAALRAAGIKAKAQYDAHYDLILPPLAVRAGLGELGRNNILIADRYGSRVRIGAVSTDLNLIHDAPRSLGAYSFCMICRKCAENCPSHALSTGDVVEERGIAKWPTHVERCYAYWRKAGTDCGICMAVCPFSHRKSGFHNLVRWMVRRLPWTDRFLLWCDDRIYGRRWRGLREG